MTPGDLRSLLEALGLREPRPRKYKPGEARLPGIAHGEDVVAGYVREVRRGTRLWFPAVVALVALRARGRKHQRRQGEER